MTTKKTKSVKSSNAVEYGCWVNMIHRCHNEDHADYPNYGGRGIRVADEWRHYVTGFTTFLADMKKRPAGYSLERLDNNQGYSEQNCEWVDRKTQQNNRRNHRYAVLDFGHGHDQRGNPIIEFNG